MQRSHVYILTNRSRTLYTGVTADLETRVRQHKQRTDPTSFTAQYNIDTLVYFEEFTNITDAIAREKQIKGWSRQKKLALIQSANPTWRNLSLDWYTQ